MEKEIDFLKKRIIFLESIIEITNQAVNVSLETNRKLIEYIRKNQLSDSSDIK